MPRHRSNGHSHPVDLNHLQIYLAICKPSESGWVYWIIILVHPYDMRCTYLHCSGQPGDREFIIDEDMDFDDSSIAEHNYIATIPVSARYTVIREAMKLPLQSCQPWACYLIFRLEQKGLVKSGTFDHYMYNYRHLMTENLGAGDDFPLGITM